MNDRKNADGYADPTAYNATIKIIKEEQEVTRLIHVLKFIIHSCGFELVGRIQLRDIKSGRIYK